MHICEHCGKPLDQIGTTVVLCRCDDSRQEETVSRMRRTSWARARQEQVDAQRKLRQQKRRQRIVQKQEKDCNVI